MKILVVGDTHWREDLSYSEYIKDGRVGEKKEILDFIIDSAKDCENIVFMGDFFNSKNNSSETNRAAVEFIERFKEKEVYIMSGNHSKKGDGSTAIDFLGEIKKPNWHIFTRPSSMEIEGKKIDFLPFMLKSELGAQTNEEAVQAILNDLDGGDILFAHHAITGFMANGIKTDYFGEPILPRKALEEKYKLVIAGHVHDYQQKERTVITGSVFTDIVGETSKFILKIDTEKLISDGPAVVELIKLPCRPIYKLENPTSEQLSNLPIHSIVKVIITDKKIDVEKLKKEDLAHFDASLVIENYPNERKKANITEGGAMDFSIESLLKMYSEERKIDINRLMNGLNIING